MLAAVSAALGGIALLVPRSYLLERCFHVGGVTGCSYSRESFWSALATAPFQIAVPLVVIAFLVTVTIVTALATDPLSQGNAIERAIAAYALTIPGISVALGPYLVAPLLFLLAAYGLALGVSPAGIAGALVSLAAFVLSTFALIQAAAVLWQRLLLGFPGGALETYLIIVAVATGVGLLWGVRMAGASGRFEMVLRGTAIAYAVVGVATVVAAGAAATLLYPDGTYVKSAAGLMTVAAIFVVTATVAAVAVARWRGARGNALVLAAIAPLFSVVAGVALALASLLPLSAAAAIGLVA